MSPKNSIKPELTVFIASWNTRKETEAAIRLTLRQQGVSLRLVVGDGGSHDGSRDMLQRLAEQGALTLETTEGGRTHGQWLDEWTARVETPLCAFVDSDLLLLRQGALRQMILRLRSSGAALVTCEQIPEIPDYVSDINGDRSRIAPRPAPWLVVFRSEQVRALDVSWQYRWERRPDLPEGALSWDVGASVHVGLTAAGLPVETMPAAFRRSYWHVGGRSWRSDRRGRLGLRDGLHSVGVQAALVASRAVVRLPAPARP